MRLQRNTVCIVTLLMNGVPSVKEDSCRAQREPPNNGKTAYPICDRLSIIVHQWRSIRNARNAGPTIRE